MMINSNVNSTLVYKPVKFESYFWLVTVKVMSSNACNCLDTHIVLMKCILVHCDCRIHIIQSLNTTQYQVK
jgi:hypothetical protein